MNFMAQAHGLRWRHDPGEAGHDQRYMMPTVCAAGFLGFILTARSRGIDQISNGFSACSMRRQGRRCAGRKAARDSQRPVAFSDARSSHATIPPADLAGVDSAQYPQVIPWRLWAQWCGQVPGALAVPLYERCRWPRFYRRAEFAGETRTSLRQAIGVVAARYRTVSQ